jgi:hypothetical protein
MAGNGRRRPAPLLQCVCFHVFSLCEHERRDSSELACLVAVSIEGVPLAVVDLLQAHTPAQEWWISVINSGGFPVIVRIAP